MSTPTPFEDVWKMFQETNHLLKEQSQETDRRFQETDRWLRELDKQRAPGQPPGRFRARNGYPVRGSIKVGSPP